MEGPASNFPSSVLLSSRLPGTFVGNAESTSPPPNAASPTDMVAATGPAVPTLPVVPTIAGAPNSAPGVEVLNPSEVKPPTSGTRRARVLYDYEAADSSELSLLSDEVGTPVLSCQAPVERPAPGQPCRGPQPPARLWLT